MNDKILKKQNFEKTKIKIIKAGSNIPLYQISVNLENFRLWDQICPKNLGGVLAQAENNLF